MFIIRHFDVVFSLWCSSFLNQGNTLFLLQDVERQGHCLDLHVWHYFSNFVIHITNNISSVFSYAKCVTADTGNTVGDLEGHYKSVNSVAYKPTRPFRIVTASEDFRTQFYEGPPFKYKEQCAVRIFNENKIFNLLCKAVEQNKFGMISVSLRPKHCTF